MFWLVRGCMEGRVVQTVAIEAAGPMAALRMFHEQWCHVDAEPGRFSGLDEVHVERITGIHRDEEAP